mgnify:CR=1 FL=1
MSDRRAPLQNSIFAGALLLYAGTAANFDRDRETRASTFPACQVNMAYSDEKKAQVLIALATNKNDYTKTAEQTGVSRRTILRWSKEAPKKSDVENSQMSVADLLEAALKRILADVPENWRNGQDWATAIGILIDKLQLMSEKPTSRTETVFKALSHVTDSELDELADQFQAMARSGAAADKD